ncbi:LuxR C-terminal-related transcriptional regulator [Castellaniella sp.]|uniref:LuxR C-terminal-related transcriptional regulator n=1 Tax=Castellaniella sp. TaxID=1955812 RepID=UPI0035652CCB
MPQTDHSAHTSAFALPSCGIVIEDMAATRDWLKQAMERAFPGINVHSAATLAQARHCMEQKRRQYPGLHGLALIDLRLPDGSGLELIPDCHALDITPIVTTIYDDDDSVFEALRVGAQGYLLKDHDMAHMVRYLRRIGQGEPPLSPPIARRILKAMHQAPPARPQDPPTRSVLSPRETEILGLIGRGMRVNDVAEHLQLTPQTVASYIKNLYRKLNISSRAQAALQAQRLGLIKPPR